MIKILIASSADLKEEREQCIHLVNQFNDSHKDMVLKPTEWDYDMMHAHLPERNTSPDEVSVKLADSDVLVLLLSSKISTQTLLVFRYAVKQKEMMIWVLYNSDIKDALYSSESFNDILIVHSSSPERLRILPYKDLRNLGFIFKVSLYDPAIAYTARSFKPGRKYD